MYYILFSLVIMIAVTSCGRTTSRKNPRQGSTVQSRESSTSRTRPVKPIEKPIIARVENTRSREVNTASRRTMSPTDIFETYNTAVFMIYTTDGESTHQGSGFFISPAGLAVSNYHVFQGTTRGGEVIKLANDQEFKVAEVLAYDQELDYILFRVDNRGASVNYIPTSFLLPKIGEKAYAIGSPKGLENTFSSGEISQIRNEYILQISVPIDHGSSGGALINSRGEAIGITTSGVGTSNLNFAMSIRVINKHLSD